MTAANGGEKRIGKFKLDGYIENENRAIEFLGKEYIIFCLQYFRCNFHGCLKCFKPGDESRNGKTMKENNENTWMRINEISKVLKVDVIWECDVRDEMKKDREMKDFMEDIGNDMGPINPRDAYFGGRTG